MNYVNGVSFPKVEERTTAGSSRTTECNIAAIDFGTTHCSVAYCMAGNNSVSLLPLDSNGNYRVPSSILIDSDFNIKAFGHHARKAYSALPTEKKKTHYYFKELKMQLQHDEKVSWSTTVCALNRTKFFLLEVIAMILKYLKNQLLEGRFSNSLRGNMTASDFDWVITVPAMWRSRGKQMMREAAYKAGIASEGVEITCLTSVEYDRISGKNLVTIPQKILDTDCLQPEKLSLAHEPESAALYCMKQAEEEAKQNRSSFRQPECYMVLDIGGGTVDISVHKIEPSGGVRVLMAPKGNDWGGTRINEKFKQFLAQLVGDEGFRHYLLNSVTPNPRQTSKRSADLDDLVNVKFEQQKRLFGNNELPSDDIVVTLPYQFINVYGDDLQKGIAEMNNKKIYLSEDELVLPTSIIEGFFADAISEITSCTLESLQSLPDSEQVEAAFFVGGFGGCKYLYNKLEKMIKEEYNPSCMTYRPEDHETAVVSGAALFRQNPEIINCRVVDASYGTGCSMRFLPQHNPAYKFYDDDRELHCNHLFAPFTLAGDVVHTDKLLVRSFVPVHHYQSSMKFTIYTSKKRDIHYVVSEGGKASDNVTELGELTVNMPDMSGDKKRNVKLFFDFSHTEIQIEAYDLTSGCRATTTVDFLSDIIDTMPQIHTTL